MIAIRGAICARGNSREAIYQATRYLLAELMARNDLRSDDVLAAFFTMTPDLNADFPAYAARDAGWTDVPMLGAQESLVPGAPERVIRILALVRSERPARHVYLGRAAAMRADLAEPGDAEAWDGSTDAAARVGVEGGALGQLLVVGLGLIGGSVAAGARASGLFTAVRGYDRDGAQATVAAQRRLVDVVVDDLGAELARADMVVLAIPVDEVVKVIDSLAEALKSGTVVTDVGSTKRRIVAAMDRLPEGVRAVGGHPMTGSTVSGASAAAAGLFRGARWALTRCDRTDEEAVRRVEMLVRGFGAEPVHIDAVSHDEMVAVTSHLPAVLAVGLVEQAAEAGAAEEELLAGPGFVSASRLADGDPLMTAQMLTDNADNLARAIESVIGRLHDLQRALADDANRLRERLAEARLARSSLLRMLAD
ncbi:MAG: chorismate mutase [Gemmatimonadetes bacterium]|nr:chorismate mutase [Gemmatimonadota bacterium]NIO32589.1 chorismate mutase [Gemmatimonadota bacterium]